MRAIHIGGHGRGELVNDDDRTLGQIGEVDDLFAQKIGEEAGLDVGHVGGTLAEQLIIHLGEHGVVRAVGIGNGLLGAHAALDGIEDHLSDALVLGEIVVRLHDGGSLGTHRGGHALDLGIGLLDELRNRSLIAFLLDCKILGYVRGE